EEEKVRKEVREGYAKIAKEGLCCGPTTSCCDSPVTHEEVSKKMGYTDIDLQSVPEGADLGLGCGNPVALASLKEGETVIDLGSGAGLDCFLAAKKIGEKGKVIGIDMTPEMIDKARENARKGNYRNVEFRLGEIENLPVADNTADVIISNCVVNLSPNKKRVFDEAFRALKPGGRLMVSDVVLLRELPEATKKRAHPASCVRTAIMKDDYRGTIRQAGFHNLRIIQEKQHSFEDVVGDPHAKVVVVNPRKKTQELKSVSELEEEARETVKEILASTASINVSAIKPTGAM
ncbi:MAG: arsenite methyltransferase, partial [Candidatus Bathyarchaeia archaeon]